MTNQLNISKRAFWDVDFSSIDEEGHKEFILRRVFEQGKWDDIKSVVKYYSYVNTLSILKELPSMSEKGLNMASIIFRVPKKEFKCYTNKPFRPSYLQP